MENSISCTDNNEKQSRDSEKYVKFVRQQEQHLLGTFPEEIWLTILNMVDCPNTLQNLNSVSLFFSRLLKPRATTFLFPNVYKVLAANWAEEGDSELRVLTGKCRLVCSFWNDHIQEVFAQFQGAPGSFDSPLETTMGTTVFPTVRSSGINEFISHFDETHFFRTPTKNPFLGRGVIFNDSLFLAGLNANTPNYRYDFWEEISNILTKYGSQIWYCTFHIEDKFPSRHEYYFKLCGWLELLPNLKGLSVIYYCNARHRNYSRAWLSRNVIEYPLPRLRYLEKLTLKNLPQPIADIFIQRNKAVRKLTLNGNPVCIVKPVPIRFSN